MFEQLIQLAQQHENKAQKTTSLFFEQLDTIRKELEQLIFTF